MNSVLHNRIRSVIAISDVFTLNQPTPKEINEAAVAIIQSYLEYTGTIVQSVMNKQGYSTVFKDINDDLIIKPSELIELIDKVQNALVSAED